MMLFTRALHRNLRPLTRSNTTLAATVYYRVNYHDGAATALTCPSEKVKWSYAELWSQISSVAGGLKSAGFGQGQVFATDVAATSIGNVLLQCGASHNGAQIMTVANPEDLEKQREMVYVSGAVMSSSSSFLAKSDLDVKQVVSDVKGKGEEGVTDRSLDLAYYKPDQLVSCRAVYLAGVGTAGLLKTKPTDIICIATSTNNLFGMGGLISGFVRNATVYLPDMNNLDLADSTFVLTDMENIDKVRAAAKKGSKLRGGVVMVEDSEGEIPLVLHDKLDVEGTALYQIVKDAPDSTVMRPLFDACVDTYYDYK
jgi:hypothetical protein